MKPILTPAEMTDADRRTIEAGTPVEVLMDRAGRAVAWAVRQRLGGTYGKRAVAVCGKGNNGGDGLVAARVLEGWGVRVDVFRLEDSFSIDELERSLQRADVAIDAMYGTGFRGKLEGLAAEAARSLQVAASPLFRSEDGAMELVPIVAVDIPSGVDGATGAWTTDQVYLECSETVTFAALKRGLVFDPGRDLAGTVTVADIGIDVGEANVGLVERADVSWWLPEWEVDPTTNKWRTGLLVIGGSGGMTGAPMMVSHAAMRTGAGIVWCCVPGMAAASAASGTEVITKAMPATADGALAGTPDEVRDALTRFRAVAIGPGLGREADTVAAVQELVREIEAPLVLDADGLNAYAGKADALRERPAPTVLTPHEGEYARLMGEPVGDDRIAAARTLAATTGCIALLKGPGTVIASPDGTAAVNTMDGPWLGTAGSGDVLTGIIGGLLARGVEPFAAAAAGAYVHGRAADLAGHTGLVAGDLITALPRTLADLTPTLPTHWTRSANA